MKPYNNSGDDVSIEDLPGDLRDDAPYKQCTSCGRKSYERPEEFEPCHMTQPNGTKCQGVMLITDSGEVNP